MRQWTGSILTVWWPTKRKPTPTTNPRCGACGVLHYYPRAACPSCLSADLTWERVSGKASLHTFTIVHRGQKGFPVPTPYVLAVVELAEGRTRAQQVPGSGAVLYGGNPPQVTTSITGSGVVTPG